MNSVPSEMPAELFPPLEPSASGLLDVGEGQSIYWEECGNPRGKAALVVHGGPGIGCTPRMRRAFDPGRYRIVLFDQRGTGRSRPHASEPTVDMRSNTTHGSIADMERLREHLGIDRWLLSGGSWGTTLALAYAERFPARVSGLVLANIALSRKRDIDWLYRGVARFFPEEWQHFRNGVPVAERDDLVRAYARAMEDGERREAAALSWAHWEDAVLSLEPNAKPRPYSDRPSADLIAFVRICSHYFAHAAWLEDDELLQNAERLSEIPGVIIHGRLDLSSPLQGAWELSRAWSRAKFHI
ncbi:MAG TPA: prolyl aminopeptidase, partial [Polyangiaceae bacterium]